jgi:hypothetical protein
VIILRESQMQIQNSGFSLKTVSAVGSKYHAVVTVFLACLCNQVPIAYSVYVRHRAEYGAARCQWSLHPALSATSASELFTCSVAIISRF